MNRQNISFLFVGLVLGTLLTTAAFVGVMRGRPIAKDVKTVLKLAHALDQLHPVHAAMGFMAKRVAELSEGKVEIQIFPNGQLGSESECIEQVQRGALAITKTGAASMEGFVPEMAVFSIPYLFRDNEHYWKVLNGPIGKEMLAAGDRVGMHGLCYYDAGSRSFYTIGKPITEPSDLRGMKIRVMQSRITMEMISMMGAAPTPIPFGEVYTALQQGMVDGAENNPPSFHSSRHYEVAKFFSLDEHARIPDLLVFSRAIWTGLSPQVQGWITQAANESVDFQRKLWQEKTQESLDALAKIGVKISRPNPGRFEAVSAPLLESLAGTPVGIMAKRIKETR